MFPFAKYVQDFFFDDYFFSIRADCFAKFLIFFFLFLLCILFFKKKSSLMVISHMILNGVLKGTGQMAPVAACLEDSAPKVADLATLFFHELSKRAGNPIYNLLPDTISQLSKDINVTPIKFKSIFKFLLSFISKDSQTIALVGKMCQRFAESMEQQQWRDIAYCLTQLPYNIRCVRKIIEGFQYYKVQVQDDIVYDCFTQIIAKARKTNVKKPEVHEELEEWAKKLERLNQGLSEEAPEGGEKEQSVAEGEGELYTLVDGVLTTQGGDDQGK